MRIVAAPDGVVTRIDRALWMTMPFDRAISLDLLITGLSAGLGGTSASAALGSTDASAGLSSVSVSKGTRQ